MKIYQNEIKDGLKEQIMATKSIAMDCSLVQVDSSNIKNPEIPNKKAIASIGTDKDFDTYYLSSVLASVGSNKNDDTFLPEEIWAAKETPVHKQFNYGHNEKDIIGCIFDSFLLDSEGKLIEDEKDIERIQDICTYSAIWTKWGDAELQDRMDQIIVAIENDELYVSMEALFKDFDYMLTSDAETKILKRSQTTAFLTKHLRSFGGSGEFEGYEIKRVLRNFTFSGKGLVSNPANTRSLIDPNLIIISKGSQQQENNESTFNMSDVLEKQVANLEAKLAEANKNFEDMKKKNEEDKEKAVSTEIDALNSKVEALETQNKELTSLAESMKEDMEDKKKKMEESKAALEADLQAKSEQIEAMEKEKVVSARVAQLVEVGQKVEAATEICKTFATATDEQFLTLVSLYKVESNDDETEVETVEASDDDEFGTVVAETKPSNLNLGTVSDFSEEQNKALAEEVRKSLLKNKE